MTLDASVFAAISYRLDTTSSLYNSSQRHCFVGEHGYLRVEEEQNKVDTKLAYSKQTRHYLRRRSWRTLRRLAEAGNNACVSMAVEKVTLH